MKEKTTKMLRGEIMSLVSGDKIQFLTTVASPKSGIRFVKCLTDSGRGGITVYPESHVVLPEGRKW